MEGGVGRLKQAGTPRFRARSDGGGGPLIKSSAEEEHGEVDPAAGCRFGRRREF